MVFPRFPFIREIAQDLLSLGSKLGKFNVNDTLPSSRTVYRAVNEEYGKIMKNLGVKVPKAIAEGASIYFAY